MYHLVIAKDKECKKYIPIKSGDYNFISKYTTRYNDSSEIRKANSKIVKDFEEIFNDYGDIVVIDDTKENKRVKVLYKKDIIVFKNLLLSQKYIQHLVERRVISNLSEWDYRVIMFRDNKSYKKDIKKVFEKRSDYYLVILNIIKNYDNYRRIYTDLPSKTEIYRAYINDQSKRKKNNSNDIIDSDDIDFYNLDSYDTSELFDKVYDLYVQGGIAEVMNMYSIDDLYSNLSEDELKMLHLNDYHR